MAFIKTGDSVEIKGYYEIGSDKPLICESCGKAKTLVAMTDEENKLMCECENEVDNE